MANPTGAYLQANPNYVWADNDVYEIQQTDSVEGAGVGASFNGIGVDNQPHQILLNKAEKLHAQQLADEAIIASLKKTAGATSVVGATGWLKFNANDTNLGLINIYFQWGTITLVNAGITSGITLIIPFSFPIPFAQACWFLTTYFNVFNTQNPDQSEYIAYPLSPYQVQNNSMVWSVVGESVDVRKAPTVSWMAIGV